MRDDINEIISERTEGDSEETHMELRLVQILLVKLSPSGWLDGDTAEVSWSTIHASMSFSTPGSGALDMVDYNI